MMETDEKKNNNMHYDMRENIIICCFVFVSSVMLWFFSLLLLPYDFFIHALNFSGILSHLHFYLTLSRNSFFLYLLHTIVSMVVHYLYIFQMGFFICQIILLNHLFFLWFLLWARSTIFFTMSCVTVEILLRHIYICTYFLLSCPHPIFYFSGYIKTI